MPSLPILLWSTNLVLDTVGHIAFKYAARDDAPHDAPVHWLQTARRPSLWVGLCCFGVEFLVWLAFLSVVPLSQGVLVGSFNIVI